MEYLTGKNANKRTGSLLAPSYPAPWGNSSLTSYWLDISHIAACPLGKPELPEWVTQQSLVTITKTPNYMTEGSLCMPCSISRL